MYQSLRAIDPFLTPDWRHAYVQSLTEKSPVQRCRSTDDKFVRLYRLFTLNRRKYAQNFERKWLSDNPHLYYAIKIFEATENQYEVPFMLEARLLSGEGYDAIARKMKTSTETVIWYEKLFFNVRDHMANTDWIFRNALLPAADKFRAARAIRDAELDLLTRNGVDVAKTPPPDIVAAHLDPSVKFLSYLGGPKICDLVLTGFDSDSVGVPVEDVSRLIEQQYQRIIQVRGLQLARAMPLNRYNATEFLKLSTAMQQIINDKNRTEDGTKSGKAKELEERLRDIIPMACLTIGMTPSTSDTEASFIDGTISGGVELDTTEMMTTGLDKSDLPDFTGFSTVYADRSKG